MGVRIGRQYALSWMKKAKNAEYRSRLQAFTYYGDALDCFDESKESLKDGRPPLSEITVEAHFCRALCLQETCADKKEVFNSYYSAIYAAKYRVTEYVGTPYDWKVLKNGLAQFSEFCNRKYHQYR